MPDPLPTNDPTAPTSGANNAAWWVTTILGGLAAILVPLATNCAFGASVCPILAAIASALTAILGVTHPGISTSK